MRRARSGKADSSPPYHPGHSLEAALGLPEWNVAVFAFLLNFVWESFMAPFYAGMSSTPHWEAVLFCGRACLGDAGIALVSFWTVSRFSRVGRRWLLHPTVRDTALFLIIGMTVAMGFEIFSTRVWFRWGYSEAMPIVPILGVGLIPFLQWLFLPPVIVWFVHKQLRSESTSESILSR